MDNLRFRLRNISIAVETLKDHLRLQGINVKQDDNGLAFSLPVGKYKGRWLIHLSPEGHTLTASGGVTSTFFGHNVWVFRNQEGQQLRAILWIVLNELRQIDGLTFPWGCSYIDICHTELTKHFDLSSKEEVKSALYKIIDLFMALFPHKCDVQGQTHDHPGQASIGRTKSSRVCRAYSPFWKFQQLRPDQVLTPEWQSLRDFMLRMLRVEVILHEPELRSTGLHEVDAWDGPSLIAKILATRFEDYGLTARFSSIWTPKIDAQVRTAHPSARGYLDYWTSGGKVGKERAPKDGTYNRMRQTVEQLGFNLRVPPQHHGYLAHGLHDLLNPGLQADLPEELKSHPKLFDRWWVEKMEQSPL